MPNVPPNRFASAPGAGQIPIPTEYGYLAWTGDPTGLVAGTAAGAALGTLQLRRLSIPGPLQIANIFVDITTAAVGATAAQCFAGVWDQNGAIIGLTADISALLGVGFQTWPLAAGSGLPGSPFIVDTPYIYVGYWVNAGTSAPFLQRGNVADANIVNGPNSVSAAQARSVTANTGLTVIGGAPLALGALAKNAAGNWWTAVN